MGLAQLVQGNLTAWVILEKYNYRDDHVTCISIYCILQVLISRKSTEKDKEKAEHRVGYISTPTPPPPSPVLYS